MWSLVMLAALGQLDPTPLPGYTPEKKSVVYGPSLPEPAIKYERVPDTTDAVAWAVADLKIRKNVAKQDVRYLRYLWVPPWGSVEWHQANSFVVNSVCSQNANIVLPEGTAGGWLIVWDLQRLAPKADDLRRLVQVWDALAINEPYFHVQVPDSYGGSVACRAYTHIDGKAYQGRQFIPAPHVYEGYSILEQDTHSFAPLLRADDFLRRATSTIEGGLYYHFIGFIRDGKRLSEAEIFEQVGLSVALSRKVEGDGRAAMFQSGVTGKPRTVEQVQGAIGMGRITYDIFDEDVDASRHAIYQLLDSVDLARGKEIIFERANGLHGFILTDGAGKLADVAPPNLVSDHRVPSPVTTQLFPPLSCIRCHGPNSGVQPVRNDIPSLLAGDLDYVDDLKSKAGRVATVERVAGLYAASDEFQADLAESRNDYTDAIFRATRGMSVRGREDVAIKAAEAVAAQYAAYWYPADPATPNVSPDQAALEYGYRVKAGEGAGLLRQVMPKGRIDVYIDGKPFEFADPALGALKRGQSIRRQDLQRVYAAGAYQIQQYRKVKQ